MTGPEVPVALVVVRGGSTIVVRCPHCGDVHFHGRSDDEPSEPGASLGHRVSHCLDRTQADHGYVLVVAPDGTTVPKRLRKRRGRDGGIRLVPRRQPERNAA